MDGTTSTTPTEIQQRVSLGLISPQPGFNPRRKFDPARIQSLTESVRNHGIIQPLLLRPRTDGGEGYWIVCGERRWRVAGIVGLPDVPSVIREMTDKEALLAAVQENQEREGITPAEEAISARRAMDAYDGDEAQAAKFLGWTVHHLRTRLLLLHAIPEVLDAAAEGKIALGHAELLATLTEELQRTVFAKVLENNITVDELRRQLTSFTQDLSAARFDTAACGGCKHNSSTQIAMFDYHVGEGRCSNRVCWSEKTTARIDSTKESMVKEFPVVFLDREKDPQLYRPVTATGTNGVGEEQYESGCKGCGNFGVVICTRPGREGEVSAPTCFGLICNEEKRSAYAEEHAAQQEPAKSDAPGKSASAKKATVKKKGAKAVMGSSPKRVSDIIDTFLRSTASAESGNSERMRKVVQVYALRQLIGHTGGDYVVGSVGKKIGSILKMSDSDLDTESVRIVAKLLLDGKTSYNRFGEAEQWSAAASRLLEDAGTPLAGRFHMSRDFLSAHTKSGIEALLASANFCESLEGDGEEAKDKALKRLLSGKHGEIVDAVMDNKKHDFSQFVPPSVESRVKDLRKE